MIFFELLKRFLRKLFADRFKNIIIRVQLNQVFKLNILDQIWVVEITLPEKDKNSDLIAFVLYLWGRSPHAPGAA